MSTDTVSGNEEQSMDQIVNEQVDQQVEQNNDIDSSQENEAVEQEVKEHQVPLAALQKERRKRQEAEIENRILREYNQKQPQQPAEPDDSQYEAVTKGELGKAQAQSQVEIIRTVQENLWIKQNPEKTEIVNDKLSEFLKQRPNLTSAIQGAANRYEEAWELMQALTPKQKIALNKPAAVKKDTPGSPASIPKAAGMNQAVDVMNMSDSEFATWRTSKRRK